MACIGPIRAVTIAAPEPQRLIDAYRLYLGYELVDDGRVGHALAQLWGRPALAGRRQAIMLPEGDGETFIRFVESRPTAPYAAFRHFGWNAAELIVQDPDALAARLAASPFRIIGPPADLSISDQIRALQVLGPAREALYLTQFKRKLPQFDTPTAKHAVDRVFIVVLGGPSIGAVSDFYVRHFDVPRSPVTPAVISVMSHAFGMPPDSRHDLQAVPLAGQSYIEIDAMPPTAGPRASGDTGELPPAIALVSFAIDALPSSGLEYVAEPRTIAERPYDGRRAAVCVGAAGELIELIEG
ncbi:MAG TPA: hypothetical protein VJ011_06595 [Steroidobacteraceae bacterium]|nr:hypothetical protein [Steroidobacteraceae bacterium]